MKERPTSKDVAQLAGVSRTTVSYVINGKSGGNVRISDETRQKVLEAARTLNYQPVSAAQMLRTNRSNLLAVMIPRVENPFYPHFAAAVQTAAEEKNFEVMIFSTHNNAQREKELLDVLTRRGVDGVITQTYQWTGHDLNRLVDAGINVVIHGTDPTHPFVDNITLDEAQAAEDMTTHLIQQGHLRIGTIAGPETLWAARLRKQGYLNALQKHNIPIDDNLIYHTRFRRGNGAEAMQALLSASNPPTAVFAANDLVAVDALLYAVDAGLSVPNDVAIAGFDNIPEATIVRPKLTTVHKDVNVLGATAAHMLMERINSDTPLPARQKMLDYQIIYRESA